MSAESEYLDMFNFAFNNYKEGNIDVEQLWQILTTMAHALSEAGSIIRNPRTAAINIEFVNAVVQRYQELQITDDELWHIYLPMASRMLAADPMLIEVPMGRDKSLVPLMRQSIHATTKLLRDQYPQLSAEWESRKPGGQSR